MTWLLADEPWLRKAARYSWCHRICRTAVLVVLEEVLTLGQLVEQPADPDPGDQPDPELDPAGPVDAGEERVGAPPGPQLVGDGLGVPLVPGEPPRGGQHGQVVVPGQLPDLLDVAGDRLVAVVDGEAQTSRRAPAAR